jgi:hypothetical protein
VQPPQNRCHLGSPPTQPLAKSAVPPADPPAASHGVC